MTENDDDNDTNDKEVIGFFQEDNGSYSSMRLMSFISLFSAIAFGFVTLHTKDNTGNGIFLTVTFLMGAFAPKSLQKFIEQRVPSKRRK